MAVQIDYVKTIPPGNPQTRPCRIIGKLENIRKTSYDQFRACLSPQVTEEVARARAEPATPTNIFAPGACIIDNNYYFIYI